MRCAHCLVDFLLKEKQNDRNNHSRKRIAGRLMEVALEKLQKQAASKSIMNNKIFSIFRARSISFLNCTLCFCNDCGDRRRARKSFSYKKFAFKFFASSFRRQAMEHKSSTKSLRSMLELWSLRADLAQSLILSFGSKAFSLLFSFSFRSTKGLNALMLHRTHKRQQRYSRAQKTLKALSFL